MGLTRDEDVIRDIQGGNHAAFAILVEKYSQPLLRVLNRYVRDTETAQDVLQESFFKTFQSLQSFEFRCSFKNWIYKITLNTARNRLRSHRVTENIEDQVLIIDCQIEEDLMENEVRLRLLELVQELPEKQRQTLELRVFNDLSFQEVASLMGCPYDTAKANYRHAMLKLRKSLVHEMSA